MDSFVKIAFVWLVMWSIFVGIRYYENYIDPDVWHCMLHRVDQGEIPDAEDWRPNHQFQKPEKQRLPSWWRGI